MPAELWQFLAAHGTAVILGVTVLAGIGLWQWRKARVRELELAFTADLLAQGMSLAEIDALLAAREPARRGMIEQFGALSAGAKTGLIVAGTLTFIVLASAISGAITSYSFWSNVGRQQAQGPATPTTPQLTATEAIAGEVFYLDLQPVANHRLNESVNADSGNSLAQLSPGRHALAGIPFQIGRRYIRLRSANAPALPLEATGIRVGLKLDRLHFLHATEFGAYGSEGHPFFVPDGQEIGHYQAHYADGSTEKIPIIYGADVRDWWNWGASNDITRGHVAWSGGNSATGQRPNALRLYRSSWENRQPDVEITKLNYISAQTAATPFCVAITAEREVP